MIQIICDNCDKPLRNKPDDINKDNPNWKPDGHATLKLTLDRGETKNYILDMDLCVPCAKKYLKVFKEV